MSDKIIDFEGGKKRLEAKAEEIKEKQEDTYKQRRKAALMQLPAFRGVLPNAKAIKTLPDVKKGEMFWFEDDDQGYVIVKVNKRGNVQLTPLDHNATVSTGLTIYDFNAQIVSKEPLFDFEDTAACEELNQKMAKWFGDTDDEYYLLYGRYCHYFTLFKMEEQRTITVDTLKEIIEPLGDIISVDIDSFENQKERVIEIWYRNDRVKADLLYLFPYGGGLVKM